MDDRRLVRRYRRDARPPAVMRAVLTAHPPEYWTEVYPYAVLPPAEEALRVARASLTGVVNHVAAEVTDELGPLEPDVDLQLDTVVGHPGQALVAASDDADLLVVGHRGRGAFVDTPLLGSVSLHCVLHAPCPVLVVRLSAER